MKIDNFNDLFWINLINIENLNLNELNLTWNKLFQTSDQFQTQKYLQKKFIFKNKSDLYCHFDKNYKFKGWFKRLNK